MFSDCHKCHKIRTLHCTSPVRGMHDTIALPYFSQYDVQKLSSFKSLNPLYASQCNAINNQSTCLTPWSSCRYVVALDPALLAAEMPALPEIPSNAELIFPPACFEMGVVGWLLYKSGIVDIKSYK